MEEIVIKTITQTEGNTKMYPPYRKERTRKPKQREGKKEETNENKSTKTRNQFDVLRDKTPETTEEETQHVQGKRVGVV